MAKKRKEERKWINMTISEEAKSGWQEMEKRKHYITSNGGYRREEKSRKHWSLFTMLLSSVTAIFFIC